MALKKLPGGVIVETDGGARLNESAGVNLEAIHRQLSGASSAALAALETKAEIKALDAVRAEALGAKAVATEARSVASTAQSTAGAAKSTADNADARVTALESSAGFGPSTPTDGTTASLILQPATQTAIALKHHQRGRDGTVYPEDYGARGTGDADDTEALEEWLASPFRSLAMGLGKYRTTRPLVSTLPRRTIRSIGGAILGDMAEAEVLRVDGDRTKARLWIDGLDRASVGLRVNAAGCLVDGGEIENLHANARMAAGVYATTGGGVTVAGTAIRRVHSVGNNKTGDATGAARGVYLGLSLEQATRPSMIHGCMIEDITGEEGDSIQIISTVADNTTTPFGVMDAIVRGNVIRGFTRRAIKIQASSVTVEDNDCADMSTELTGSETSIINVINTEDAIVRRNHVRGVRYQVGIAVLSASDNSPRTKRATVQDNRADLGDTGYGIRVSRADDVTVTGNEVHGGAYGVELDFVNRGVFRDNTSYGAPGGLAVKYTCSDIRTGGNVAYGGPVRIESMDSTQYAGSVQIGAATVPSNTPTVMTWDGWTGGPATVSATGVVTPEPGRYRIRAVVAATPGIVGGAVSVRLVNGNGSYIAQEITNVTKTAVGSWSVDAVATFVNKGSFTVQVHQSTGVDLPINTTKYLSRLQITRLD